jgi:hypothetical protein
MPEQAEATRRAPGELPGADGALCREGFELDELDGDTVGRVAAVMVDAEHGSPAWARDPVAHGFRGDW